jgi:hypothetical protein
MTSFGDLIAASVFQLQQRRFGDIARSNSKMLELDLRSSGDHLT